MKTKTFNHVRHDIPVLERVEAETGRLYRTKEGRSYPSVTAVTGLYKKDEILEWRKRVGEDEANRISSRSARRGTSIHSLREAYLSNEPSEVSMFDIESFNSLVPELDKIINIHCLETKLYSDYLQVAGTVDCIAEYKGKLSVIDFKTSRREKKRDEIHNYFMQTAAYAVMFEERTGIPVSRLVVLMAVDDHKEATVFNEKRDAWIGQFINLREEYRKWKGI